MTQWLVIPSAFVLDLVIGDPRFLPHPIRWMGRCIEVCEPFFRRLFRNEILAGASFALAMIIGCWSLVALLIYGAYGLHSTAGLILEVVLVFYCLSARSLWLAAMEIHQLLKHGHVDEARSKLSMIVGRDVDQYGADDIARATVETVAENFVDGVLSPLFFASIGGAPLAMAYKMVNTLDSMVGYKNARYHRFGRWAARIDDVANWLPARLSVLIISLAAAIFPGRNAGRTLYTALKEGSHHSSPNAGYPEAAFAGVLKVKLNGPNYYKGRLVDKPFIGVNFGIVKQHHIQKACELMLLSALITSVVAWAVYMATHWG